MANPNDSTQLASQKPATAGELFQLVYDELRRLAHHHMQGERRGHTLQTTDLLHETWLRLAGYEGRFNGRSHFFAVAATCMRHILVDYAKGKQRGKRGGEWQRVSWAEALSAPAQDDPAGVIALDEALEMLAQTDELEGRIAEMHYFAGLSRTEIAAATGRSEATVRRRLRSAQARLQQLLEANV